MRSWVLVVLLLVIALGDPAGAQDSPDREAPRTSSPDRAANPASLPPPPATTSQDNALPPPVYSRVASFTIPFSVTQPDAQPLEVLLFVSHDYGANWVLYSRQPATLGQFAFRTNQDGDYWFASRTHPIGTVVSAGATFRPELRVIVDTLEPRLDVQAALTPTGEIQVHWQAVDDAIAPDTLKIQYQEAIGRPYRPVSAPAGQPSARNTVAGQATWQVEPGSYFVSIRVEIQDRAGNAAEVIRRLIVPAALNAGTRPPAGQAEAGVPPDPMANYGMAEEPASPPAPFVEQEVQKPRTADSPQPITWPSDDQQSRDHASDPFGPQTSGAGSKPSAATRNPATSSADEAETETSARENDGETDAAQGQAAGRVEAREVASSGGRLLDDTANRSGEQDETPSAPVPHTPSDSAATGTLPTGERPRMTRSKRFNLDYSVDAVGPAGVEKVELWVTRNGGLDWDLGWVDEDRTSPLLVEVEEEGVYGFRLVIVGKNGLASQSPGPGDLADLWIGVDSTQPTVEITSAVYGDEEHAGQLEIRWNAADVHLANRPITLSFSDQQDGPWTTIAASLPNTGQYFWRVDSRVPAQFYLRIQARDEAGNMAVHHLKEPLQSAGLSPKASIRGFAPAAQ
jgi:hypothetical protein